MGVVREQPLLSSGPPPHGTCVLSPTPHYHWRGRP